MKIDLSTFQILSNYVLVKPDNDIESYQIAGRETGIIAPSFKYEGTGENEKRISVKERNVSVTGTVYATPKHLYFNLDDIRSLKNNYTTHKVIRGQLALVNFPVQFQIDQLTKGSVQFKVPMEVKVGDRVNFSYMAHKQCIDEGRLFETEYGIMYLMKYDMLFCTVDKNHTPITMLNGWVLVEPEEIETLKEGAQEFLARESGLVLLTPKNKAKKSKKNQLGIIKNFGTICEGYLQQPDKSDDRRDLSINQKVLYDPRMATKLEYETHQIFSDKVHHLIQRKDMWIYFDKEFDFSSFSLEKIRRSA